jgi:hypothetical protein
MRVVLGVVLALAVTSRGAAAQNEGALRAALEGRTVVARLDMPATSQGVDLYPQDQTPLNVRELADRLKENGTAIRIGQSVMITKVVVKKNSHIEFQLGGGGYGTFGDWATNGSNVSTVSAGETRAEKALRDSARAATDKGTRRRMERDADALRSARERENSRAAADAQQANIARETLLRSKRAESGSRFNLRYRQGIPPEALTPEGVMRALASYVEFPGAPAATIAMQASGSPATVATASFAARETPRAALREAPAAAEPAAPAGSAGVAAIRKGLTVQQVEALLGPAATAAEVKEGTMLIAKRSYRRDGMQVAARFVSGVLIDFAITPQ